MGPVGLDAARYTGFVLPPKTPAILLAFALAVVSVAAASGTGSDEFGPRGGAPRPIAWSRDHLEARTRPGRVRAATDPQSARPRSQRVARRTPSPALQKAPAVVRCPAELGVGVTTGRRFCDVLMGRDLRNAVRIELPPHRGPALLAFDLHNRHTYSEEEVRAGRAYAEYTAIVGILTPDGTLLARGVVRSEFRSARDLLDRVAGGAGPDGVKAVAPLGRERIFLEVPEAVTEVLVLGERLEVARPTGREAFIAPGRPMASLSDVEVEYRPAPAGRPRR